MSEHTFLSDSDSYKYALAEFAPLLGESVEHLDDLMREFISRQPNNTTHKMDKADLLACAAVDRTYVLRTCFEQASDSRHAWRERALELGHEGPIHVERGERHNERG